jgi:hypothetical protein
MSDDENKPPRPTELQRMFLEEWSRDRAEGITPRSTYKMLEKHLGEDKTFQEGALQRMTALETSAKRDGEDRANGANGWGPNGTGRFHIPPPPKTPSFKPWWSQDPWKTAIRYALVALISLGIGWVARHYSMPAPALPQAPVEHPR